MNNDIKEQIGEFISYWQNFMTKWIKFADSQKLILESFIGQDEEYYKFGNVHNTVSNYMPEPYFGNPNNLPEGKIHAVFINLNPGSATDAQSHYKEGGYVTDFRNNDSNYQQVLNIWNDRYYSYKRKVKELNNQFDAGSLIRRDLNKKLRAIEKPKAYGTLRWWDNFRAQWVESFIKPKDVNYQIEIQHILGLELSPWHSKVFADIKDIDIDFAISSVVDKAVMFSKHIHNPYLRDDNRSLVLTCGAGFKNFFNAKKWEEITPDFLKASWKVWQWKYDTNTSIINFHQTNTKGAVRLNFPDDEINNSAIQKFLLKQL